MNFDQVITELSKHGIRAKDHIVVSCDDNNKYIGRIIKKTIIDTLNDTEFSVLIHSKDDKMCLCLKTRPDGIGPDTADVIIYLDEILSISKN